MKKALWIYWIIIGLALNAFALHRDRELHLGMGVGLMMFGGIIAPTIGLCEGIAWLDRNVVIRLERK